MCFNSDRKPSYKLAEAAQEIIKDSGLDDIENLPRGQILGVALFCSPFWVNTKTIKEHDEDPWILGPFVYKILDCVRLENGIPAKGKLGGWQCDKYIHQQVINQYCVNQKINEWKHTYGDQFSYSLYFYVYFILFTKYITISVLCLL